MSDNWGYTVDYMCGYGGMLVPVCVALLGPPETLLIGLNIGLIRPLLFYPLHPIPMRI